MKRFVSSLVLGLAVSFMASNAKAQCQYDTQCKGDRICVKGECVSPGDAKAAAKPAPAPKKKPAPPPPKPKPKPKPEPKPPPPKKEAAPPPGEEELPPGVVLPASLDQSGAPPEPQSGSGLGTTTPDEQDMDEAIDLGEQEEAEAEAARREAGPPFEFSVGLRLGFGLPMGEANEESPLSDTFNGQIPIWLDAGFKVHPNVLVGLYFQYGFGLITNGACIDDGCSGSVTRFGVQGHYEVSPDEFINPWVGLGIGYEWSHVSGPVMRYDYDADGERIANSGEEVDTGATLRGWEFANVQGGAQFELMRNVSVGPFLSLSIGRYNSCSVEFDGEDQDCRFDRDLGNKAIHQWVVIGARGGFEFWPFQY